MTDRFEKAARDWLTKLQPWPPHPEWVKDLAAVMRETAAPEPLVKPAAERMESVAVYGGSFDPPHLGHLMVVSHLLLNDPSVDRIVIMPCFLQEGKDLTAFTLRKSMVEKAFGHFPRVEISDLEYRLGGESITLRSMKALKAENPTWNLRFVMGTDLLETCHTWEGWEELKEIAPPLPVGRAGISPVREGQPSPIAPLASSTLVRAACAKKDYREAGRYLCRGVLEEIINFKLYT